jgi:uncharacterized delta-60 repeat protein
MPATSRFVLVFSVVVLTCLSLIEPAAAGAGDLDPTFGDGGTKIVAFPGNRDFIVSGLAIDPDGRPVVVGIVADGPHDMIGVARFTVDGQPDTTFSGDGFATIDLSLAVEGTGGVAVQPDRRIVVSVRRARGDFAKDSFGLVRLTAAGRLDPSFGDHGELLVPAKPTPPGQVRQLSGVGRPMVDGAGRILLPGSSNHGPSSASEMFVLRSTPRGVLDATFGTNGIAWVRYGNYGVDEGWSLAPGGNGRVLLAGSIADYRLGTVSHDGALVRFRPDGTLDPGFGSSGKVRVHGLYLDDVVRMPSGAIAASGWTRIDEHDQNVLGVVRVTSVGDPDRSFSGDGRVLFRFPNSYMGDATDLLADGTALEVTASVAMPASVFGQGVARLRSNGTFDTTFSGDGKTTLFRPNQTGTVGIAKQGNRFIAGTGTNDLDVVPSYRVALARLLRA